MEVIYNIHLTRSKTSVWELNVFAIENIRSLKCSVPEDPRVKTYNFIFQKFNKLVLLSVYI